MPKTRLLTREEMFDSALELAAEIVDDADTLGVDSQLLQGIRRKILALRNNEKI